MRRMMWAFLVGVALTVSATARGQEAGNGNANAPQTYPVYGAPGYYGMAFGVPSFGSFRTYSEYSSSYGGGYGYGYGPYSILPGGYGLGIWRQGFSAPGYTYAPGYYRTFPLYPVPGPVLSPPVGMYAPAFGPPAF